MALASVAGLPAFASAQGNELTDAPLACDCIRICTFNVGAQGQGKIPGQLEHHAKALSMAPL